jgi:hypothetical protein
MLILVKMNMNSLKIARCMKNYAFEIKSPSPTHNFVVVYYFALTNFPVFSNLPLRGKKKERERERVLFVFQVLALRFPK